MYRRLITLILVCCALGFGGYDLSKRRAAADQHSLADVIAAAGGEPAFLSGSETSSDEDSYRISSLSVFSNVALHVKDNYVDPDRIEPRAMLIASLREVERQIAEVLVEELSDGQVRVRVMDREKVIRVDDVENLWEINLRLRDVFRFLEKTLPPQKDMRSIEYAAINGALSTLDPHSVLLKPEAFAEMKTSTKGEFGGLGIVISVKETKLTIVAPLEGTPAWRAGLKAGDAITRIGDVSTVSMPIEEAVRMLRGPEGSKVTIWIDRKGWNEPRRFTIMRERIKIESVESSLLSGNVGYIKIKNFQQNTGKDLEEHLSRLQAQAGKPLAGLVLDLRNNPGGLLEQAIRVSDKFLTSGDIVTTVGYGNKLREPKRARWSGTQADIPLAVLVNKGSASASEIVAGALKNLDRAVIIGERTFGKGSVQVLYDFADNSALKLTIAQYLTPGGISIQNEGVGPDIALRRAWLEEASVRLFHQPQGHRERNLDKHLDRGDAPGAANPNPTYDLTYLIDRHEQPAEEGEETSEETKAFEEDYPITLAREFLSTVGNASRSKMLTDGRDFVQARTSREEEKTVTAMKKLGIDWSMDDAEGIAARSDPATTPTSRTGISNGASSSPLPATTSSANVDVSFAALAPFARGIVPAGGEIKLVATIKNKGNSPIYRLHGVLESENGAFKGRELLFGKILPGKSRSWTVSTKTPKETASRSDFVTLKLENDAGPLPTEPQVLVKTEFVPHPQFAYNYAFDDSERGDGDGVLEEGEGVDFVVYVTNTGEGAADDVALRLKSGAGDALFLERGRANLAKIPSGATVAGRLRFRVKKGGAKPIENLPLELTIYDASTGEWLEDEINLTPAPAHADHPKSQKGVATIRRDTQVFSNTIDNLDVLATARKGTRLERAGRHGDFIKVQLVPDGFGWVLAKDASTSAKGHVDARASAASVGATVSAAESAESAPSASAPSPARATALAGLTFQMRRRPPTIRLDTDIGGSIVDTNSITLRGEVIGRSLRDMYIVLNDRKIFFKSSSEDQAKPNQPPFKRPVLGWVAPNEEAAHLPFQLELDLENGLNKVAIVARLDERVMSYRSLFISRRPLAAVAEASTGKRASEKKATR
ncbi:MAG: PDZ domain-containing protein [Deltaproteobacteria bacterium]|nr:PDZ domain-containing protein [Deltaproteobacteria bacterium]